MFYVLKTSEHVTDHRRDRDGCTIATPQASGRKELSMYERGRSLINCRYSTMDNVDGKQARRTGTSSGLGELFEYDR